MSRRLEWLYDDDDDAAVTPTSGERPRGGLVDGRYELVERLGAGAMGVVYLAEDIWLGRRVAIKVLVPSAANSAASTELLRQEARALAKVRHENVVQVYALGPHGGSLYIAMEHVAGEGLDSLIARHARDGDRVDLARAIGIVAAVARGLSVLHASGLVHRDVKPSNILLETHTGRPVLVDLGLVKAGTERALPGGTPCYMAPEQVNDDHAAIGPASDLYALACTAFELLTGRTPFDGEDNGDVLLAHLRREPPRISSFRASLAPLDAVFRRALAKAPADRQATCDAFAAELIAAAERAHKRASTPVTIPPPAEAEPVKPLRVIILEADEALRRQIVRLVDRTMRAGGDDVEIEHVMSASELGAACMREPPHAVIIDEQTTNGVTPALVRALGERVTTAIGGELAGGPEVLVLRKSFEGAKSADEESSRVVELPKPFNPQVLASVLARMTSRIVDRRRRAL